MREEEERKEREMESKEEKKNEKESKSSMTPWEQHASVISITRFDYKAPSSLLQRSHCAFLVTCTIKREKSATKEAMSIFSKYVGSFNSDTSGCFESSDKNAETKRRKICTEETDQNIANSDDSTKIIQGVGENPKDDCSAKTGKSEASEFGLSLVKLTRSGLLLLTFPGENSLDTTDIVSNIVKDLEYGSLKSPLWCHRIFPIQATCALNEKELLVVVSKLVLQFVNDKRNKLEQPLNLQLDSTEEEPKRARLRFRKMLQKDSELSVLLDRNKCFSVVAAAVKGIVSDSVGDLKSPELSVLVDLLPISGIPNGSLVVGVSVLP